MRWILPLPFFLALLLALPGGGEVDAGTRQSPSAAKLLCDVMKFACGKPRARNKTARKRGPSAAVKAKPAQTESSAPTAATTKQTGPPVQQAALPVAAAAAARIPIPVPRPSIAPRVSAVPKSPIASTPAPAGASRPEEAGHQHEMQELAIASAEERCRSALLELGFDFSVPERMEAKGRCKVDNAVQLKSLATTSGRVLLPAHPILSCPFARQFGVWLADVAAPVVAAHGEAKLAALSTGPGYECRGRNGDSSGKVSEHAFGNAVDIDGITLTDRKRVEIADISYTQHPRARMLTALRVSACGYFTTVLGPGANAAHASHFHFDLGLHGRSRNYRICE